MRFLADMGISRRVTEWLKSSGHDVLHLADEHLQQMPNGEIFLKAARESRIVLTFDLDFGEILALVGEQFVSVVLFRLHNTRTAHVISRLQDVLSNSSELLNEGAIILVEEGRHRVRQLPLRRQ